MRCGECEAAGLVEPCFCPCCGRPLTSMSVAPVPAEGVPAAAADPEPCASCGAPAPPARELCDRCEDAFQRVLLAATPPSDHAHDADDDSPTLITTLWDEHAAPALPYVPGEPALEPHSEAAIAEPRTQLDTFVAPATTTAYEPVGGEEPKPWWEVSAPEHPAANSAGAMAATSAPAPTVARDIDEPVAAPDARDPIPAPRVTLPPPSVEAQPRVARPRRGQPVARTRGSRPRASRAALLALAAASICIVGLVGAPHVLDLVWSAPAPATSAASEPLPAAEDPVSPLPDTAGLVPATDPSAPPPPAPASSGPPAAATKPGEPPGKPARNAPRADASAATRAARLLQQRAAAAQAGSAPTTAAPPAPVAAFALPPMVPAPAPAAEAAEPAPTPVDLGQIFEVTQVDVRPQVRQQVPPRRPDKNTTADVVVVRVLVSPAGRAADVRVVRSAKGAAAYDSAAIDAVKQWTFTPAQKRSRPVSCWVHVGVPFAAGDPGL